MKVKYEGKIYDVVDGYSQGYIIEKEERGYKYVGKLKRQCEVVDNNPIEYTKSKKFLAPKISGYSKTKFMNIDYDGEVILEEDTIIVFNNVVAFYSPAKHSFTLLDIKASERTKDRRYIWGFEKHEDDTISLSPSIKSTQHEFQEHYFIKRNKVVNWCNDSWETVYIKNGVSS